MGNEEPNKCRVYAEVSNVSVDEISWGTGEGLPTKDMQPSDDHIMQLWQDFVDRVNSYDKYIVKPQVVTNADGSIELDLSIITSPKRKITE